MRPRRPEPGDIGPPSRRFPVAWLDVGAHGTSQLVQFTGLMRPRPAATSISGPPRGGCRPRPTSRHMSGYGRPVPRQPEPRHCLDRSV